MAKKLWTTNRLKDSFFNLFFITTFINFLNKAIFKYNKDFLFTKNVGYVDGGAIVVRKSAFDDVLGFDESFFSIARNDFCLKLKKLGGK